MASATPPAILIIDDSLDHQELLRLLLEGEGFQVIAAFNGKEALEMLDKMATPPALILLDLMMPVMDGFAFRAEQLRAPDLSRIPVIIMSASGQAEEQLTDLQASGFLKKPMDIDELLRLSGALTRGEIPPSQVRPTLIAAHETESARPRRGK